MSEPDVGSRGHEAEAEPLVRHEEELTVDKETGVAGKVRVRKRVDTERTAQTVARDAEYLDDVERVPADEGDSGEIETLPDGSVSIPVLEEELVVTKRLVVRERVIVRKRTETEQRRIEADVRRERVEVDVDDDLRSDAVDASFREEEQNG